MMLCRRLVMALFPSLRAPRGAAAAHAAMVEAAAAMKRQGHEATLVVESAKRSKAGTDDARASLWLRSDRGSVGTPKETTSDVQRLVADMLVRLDRPAKKREDDPS